MEEDNRIFEVHMRISVNVNQIKMNSVLKSLPPVERGRQMIDNRICDAFNWDLSVNKPIEIEVKAIDGEERVGTDAGGPEAPQV